MKAKRIFPAITILILATLACQTLVPTTESTTMPLPTQPQSVQQPQSNIPPLTESEVPRISVSEAKAALDAGTAALVDVRSTEVYVESHAAGAISIPLTNFEAAINGIPLKKDQWIITYCT